MIIFVGLREGKGDKIGALKTIDVSWDTRWCRLLFLDPDKDVASVESWGKLQGV